MATVINLTEEQIKHLLREADELEHAFKDLHDELARVGTPKETMVRFGKLHDRFTSNLAFLRHQRALGGKD